MAALPQIAVIGPFPPIKGGISQHTAHLADALAEAGAIVSRHSWSSQYPKRLYSRPQLDPEATTTEEVDWSLQWWNPITWIRVARQVRAADVVVMAWVSPAHAPLQLLVLKSARRSLRIVHVHNVLPHEPMPFSRLFARLVLGRADVLMCHAQTVADEAHELGITTDCVVTPMPALLDVRATPLPAGPPRLLFLGMIRRYKGLDTLLEACHQLGDIDGLEVTVAGEVWSDEDRPEPADLERCPVPITTRFEYLGDSQMIELLEQHHLLVAPYRAATQSGVVSLALAAGRPVVATSVGGLAEAVTDGTNGVLCEPDDPTGLAVAIRDALRTIDALAGGARESPPTWSAYAGVLLAHYSAR